MSKNLQIVTIHGNLTKNIEVVDVNGHRKLGFTVCVTQRDESTIYYDCSVFGNRADPLAKLLRGGKASTVVGVLDIKTSNYTDKEGNAASRTYYNLDVVDVTLPDTRDEQNTGSGPRADDGAAPF